MRKFKSIMILVILVILLTSIFQIAQGANKVLNIALATGPWNPSVEYLFDMYSKETGTEFKLTKSPYMDHYRKMVQAMMRGSKDYDMIIFDPAQYGSIFFENKLLTPLKEISPGLEIPSAVIEPHVKTGIYHDVLYSLPIVGNTQLLFYRKDLLDDAGLPMPETVEDLITINKKLYNPPKMYGYLIPMKQNYDVIYNTLYFVKSAGGDIFATEDGPDWTIKFTSPESVKAYEAWFALKEWSTPDSANMHWSEENNYLATQRSWGGSTVAAWVWAHDDPKYTQIPGKMQYAVTPRVAPGIGKSAPILGTWGMGIPKEATNKELALDFMEWTLTKEAQSAYAKVGGIAVREDVLTDPELLSDPKNRWFPALLESSRLGQLRPQMEHWMEVQDILVPYLHKAFTDQISLKEALNKSAVLIEKLLDEEGYQHGPTVLIK